jgi:hypothetical protein
MMIVFEAMKYERENKNDRNDIWKQMLDPSRPMDEL